ncbi:MAG: phosphate signaling complex protein PhoU [Smithellaceae bacterium]|jgi:phosphate transport system protein|nr:PhoU family transcriptional regulator [Smithella sp. F21]MDD4860548.1 phosphate signaling complex protein PhoU [Smithellaceae bacterium]MDD5413308.1 phosphate signaling complex protein PhoU [Smithellaceae bacterium]HBJ75903.1 phosphate transport system regulatory protein PhoU [Syntrophaceae bacterium]
MEEKRHTSLHYEKELQEIKDGLIYQGALTEKAIQLAMRSLSERNSEIAKRVIKDDEEIDKLDTDLEERCIKILALRQPTAIDLRFITTAIKITGHLERIGDMAVNIAEKALQLNDEPQLKPYIDLPRMTDLVSGMIKDSLDSFIRNDLAMAERVRRTEQMVDDLNEQIFREILTFMMEDSKSIHRGLLIMQVSKNMERIADHAKGIADMVTYMVTGECVRHQTCHLTE